MAVDKLIIRGGAHIQGATNINAAQGLQFVSGSVKTLITSVWDDNNQNSQLVIDTNNLIFNKALSLGCTSSSGNILLNGDNTINNFNKVTELIIVGQNNLFTNVDVGDSPSIRSSIVQGENNTILIGDYNVEGCNVFGNDNVSSAHNSATFGCGANNTMAGSVMLSNGASNRFLSQVGTIVLYFDPVLAENYSGPFVNQLYPDGVLPFKCLGLYRPQLAISFFVNVSVYFQDKYSAVATFQRNFAFSNNESLGEPADIAASEIFGACATNGFDPANINNIGQVTLDIVSGATLTFNWVSTKNFNVKRVVLKVEFIDQSLTALPKN